MEGKKFKIKLKAEKYQFSQRAKNRMLKYEIK